MGARFGIYIMLGPPPGGGGVGAGLLGLIFAWNVPLASQDPYPIIVYSKAILLDPILVTFRKK